MHSQLGDINNLISATRFSLIQGPVGSFNNCLDGFSVPVVGRTNGYRDPEAFFNIIEEFLKQQTFLFVPRHAPRWGDPYSVTKQQILHHHNALESPLPSGNVLESF